MNAAATLTVAISGPRMLAASSLPGGVLDAGNAELLARHLSGGAVPASRERVWR